MLFRYLSKSTEFWINQMLHAVYTEKLGAKNIPFSTIRLAQLALSDEKKIMNKNVQMKPKVSFTTYIVSV